VNTERVRFMQGNEAILEGALAAGARFFGGYPITPSSEIAERAARRLPALGGVYMQMEDELASMAAVIGASAAGGKSFTATSGPGFSLMQENLGVAVMAEIPCVVINVQRSGPSTGLATKPAQADVMQARWGTHGDHAAIALCPGSVQECFELTVRAFNLAEEFRHPVILLTDEIVGHMREGVCLPEPGDLEVVTRRDPGVPPGEFRAYSAGPDGIPVALPPFGSPYIYHVNSSMHDETGFPNSDPRNAERTIKRLHDKVVRNAERIHDVVLWGSPEADVLVVTYGGTTRAALQVALDGPVHGHSVAVLQLRSLWPFPDEPLRVALKRRPTAVVAEMNLGQMIGEARRVLGPDYPCHSFTKSNGQPIMPGELAGFIREVVA